MPALCKALVRKVLAEIACSATQEEKYLTLLALAAGRMSEDELAEWILSRCART